MLSFDNERNFKEFQRAINSYCCCDSFSCFLFYCLIICKCFFYYWRENNQLSKRSWSIGEGWSGVFEIGKRRSKGNCKYILNLLFPLLILLVFIYFSWIAFESKISRKEVTLHILFVEPEINFLNLIINDILESFLFLLLPLPPPPSFFSPFFILRRNFCYFWLCLFLLFTTSNLTGGCKKERCLESEREILYIQIPLEKLAQKKLYLRP